MKNQVGYVSHFDVWLLHQRKNKNLLGCIFMGKSNKNIIMEMKCDKEWIVYNNNKWKCEQIKDTFILTRYLHKLLKEWPLGPNINLNWICKWVHVL